MNRNENKSKQLCTSIKKKKGQDHKNTEPSLWSQIPATVVLAIYMYLGDKDRVSMARVCQAWYQGFKVPALWRSRIIEFGEIRTEEEIEEEVSMNSETGTLKSYGKCAVKFAKQFPTSLQDIEIYFNHVYGQDGKVIVKDFKQFSACLDGAKLRNISIAYLDIGMVSRKMQKDVIDSFKRLLQNQRSLQKCQIKCSFFDLETGLQIIQCLAEASGATIEDLSLEGLFHNGTPINPKGRVLTEMQKFTGLSRIHFDYYFISEELAKSWVMACPNLSFIRLVSDEYIHPTHVVSCETWKSLVRTHPNLLVEFNASDIQDTKHMLDILSPAIPLFDLSWERFEDTTEFEMIRLLHRVAHYHRTIRYLSLRISGQFPNLDTKAVQNILSKCTKLLPFQCEKETNPVFHENKWNLSQNRWWFAQNNV
ncbi:unnamed protein product [Lymnaea stagnalis]|uniref:F-box domain-containing protein n=1 Tax=Lymnaea stagnalis TaxID=6523 RepID=A0AAV2H8Y9_LYMST